MSIPGKQSFIRIVLVIFFGVGLAAASCAADNKPSDSGWNMN
jgi:hypothetical protein